MDTFSDQMCHSHANFCLAIRGPGCSHETTYIPWRTPSNVPPNGPSWRAPKGKLNGLSSISGKIITKYDAEQVKEDIKTEGMKTPNKTQDHIQIGHIQATMALKRKTASPMQYATLQPQVYQNHLTTQNNQTRGLTSKPHSQDHNTFVNTTLNK